MISLANVPFRVCGACGQDAVNGYEGRFQDESLTERTTTDEYYDLATDFYLYGWGSSFHFATRFLGESLEDSIVRPGRWHLKLPAITRASLSIV